MIKQTLAVILVVVLPALLSAQNCSAVHVFASRGYLAAAGGTEAQCSVSRVLGGGRSEDCYWRFGFRSDAALRHFEGLKTEMKMCADGPLQIEVSGVNHPDSFDQVTADVRGVSLSLSLKDKGGLSETLVFVRRTLP